ncbi:MAG TPA: Gfo/Idh/MocA family oxidoreductase [Planctomycetaceae bacterium]|nr:Gfo/Idh/MocA family oxidoreductase [Planctomycetaceae bacterium]
MTTPFRLAFLGIDNPHGAGWRQLLQNFGDELEITAIMPGLGGSTASLEERYARVPRFETVDELIDRGEFDGAVVCLPNHEAPSAIVKLAHAGKHVLVEKPGAGRASDVDPICAAVAKSGVAFQSGYMWRYDEGANRLREMVADKRFGKLISIEMLYVTSDVKRRDPGHYLFDKQISTGGFFNWLACHYLDLLLYITQQAVVGVTARTGVFGGTATDVEDGGTAIFDLDGGGLATIIGGYWLPRWAGENHWSLRGTERWVHWDPAKTGTSGELEIHGPKPQWSAMDETLTLPPDETPGYGGARGMALVRDWLDSARDPGKTCRNTPLAMRNALALIDAIEQSSCEGRRIACRIEPA